jgi:acetyltransferase-like isoleucine patch superfamily enzyme
MKRLLRNLLVAVAVVLTLPLWLAVRLTGRLGRNDDLFLMCSQIVSIVPGVLGLFLRRGFYCMTLESCARDCSIGCATWLSHPQVRIGSGVYIGGRCSIGMCEIGDDVLIGSNVDILSGRHQHNWDHSDKPRKDQGGAFTKVHIGRNAWIGNSAVIMADIGDHSVIGAGSVVVRSIPPQSVAVGNPAIVKNTNHTDRVATPTEGSHS